MFKNPLEFRGFTFDLSVSVWTFAALGVLFESGLATELLEPRSLEELAARVPKLSAARIERCLALSATTGAVRLENGRYQLAEATRCFAGPPQRSGLEGELRGQLMQALAFLDAARDGNNAGWSHSDRSMLQAQGDASSGFAPMFKANMLASLGDLGERLARPGAKLLDVGVGVGALAIAMCRAFPTLGVVGVDTSSTPLAIARENIEQAGLAARIELKELAVEALTDEVVFELVWLPSFFVAEKALPAAVARVHAGLKPGGWLLMPIGVNGGDERQRATLSLVCELWGGPALSVAEAQTLLQGRGFSQVRCMQGPAWAPALMVAQR
jgi:Methyltransferase domain